MTLFRVLAAATAATAGCMLTACATATGSSGGAALASSGTASNTTGVARVASVPMGVTLVGNFAPTQQRTGSLAPTEKLKAYGTITLSAVDATSRRTRVVLDVSTPFNNATVAWALHPGQCGAASLPVLAVNVFPSIDLGGNGRGHVEGDIPLEMPREGQFHANVYNEGGGQQLENVMTCANLRYEQPKSR